MGRSRGRGAGIVGRHEKPRDRTARTPPLSHFDHRSDEKTHHVMEKTVCRHFEHPAAVALDPLAAGERVVVLRERHGTGVEPGVDHVLDEHVDLLAIDGALVAGGAHPSPFPHAHVATSTTHKTLRGPRGGIILSNDEDLAKKMNSAVFPGMQGGPLMHVIAAKAVAFGEALTPEFKAYTRAVVENAKVLADTIMAGGFKIVTGGTDNHLMLVDLRPKGITGKASEAALGRAHITCNKNGVPFDPEKPMITSGIRLGTPAATSRGFGIAEFQLVGELIAQTLDGLAVNGEAGNSAVETAVKARVSQLTARFPIY